MIAVVSRVNGAKVSAKGLKSEAIEKGVVVLLGVKETDTSSDAQKLAKKVSSVRVFSDEKGKLNQNIKEVDGSMLIVSQFTLAGTLKSGTRPSFSSAAGKNKAERLYQQFIGHVLASDIKTKTGFFGKDMKLKLDLDGPVTLIFDTKNL